MSVLFFFDFLVTMPCVIASFNVNGLRQTLKRKAIFHYLKQKRDVILLQETRSTSTDEKQWACEW